MNIKFKQYIWDYDDDKLAYIHYWGFIEGKFVKPIIDTVNPEHNYQSYQFTGLTDKQGVEIYEGDIVDVGDENIAVEFDDGAFVLFGENYSDDLHYFNQNDIEVIGNIYENPELLTT